MRVNGDFVSWLDAVRANCDAARVKKDSKLGSVLPMQFEVGQRLVWSDRMHWLGAKAAICEAACYCLMLAAVVAVLARHWVPDVVWIALAGLMLVTWLLWKWYEWRERPARVWLQQAEVVPGALVYANRVLSEPGPQAAAPGAFVFTFDPDLAGDPQRLASLGETCFALHAQEQAAPANARALHDKLAAWSKDRPEGDPHTFDRVAVPAAMCGNAATFVTFVAISRRDLPDGVIDRRVYPLLARRDRNESAALVPSAFWNSAPSPPA